MDATVPTLTETFARPLTGAGGDYDPLLEMIGAARFVLLGEASHGTTIRYAALRSCDSSSVWRRIGAYASPNSRIAFSLRINGRASSRMAIFSKSASQRSGAISG